MQPMGRTAVLANECLDTVPGAEPVVVHRASGFQNRGRPAADLLSDETIAAQCTIQRANPRMLLEEPAQCTCAAFKNLLSARCLNLWRLPRGTGKLKRTVPARDAFQFVNLEILSEKAETLSF